MSCVSWEATFLCVAGGDFVICGLIDNLLSSLSNVWGHLKSIMMSCTLDLRPRTSHIITSNDNTIDLLIHSRLQRLAQGRSDCSQIELQIIEQPTVPFDFVGHEQPYKYNLHFSIACCQLMFSHITRRRWIHTKIIMDFFKCMFKSIKDSQENVSWYICKSQTLIFSNIQPDNV